MDLLYDNRDEVRMKLMEVRMKMKWLCNKDRMNDCFKSCDGAVDMSNIPSEEQDKVLKILGMTESQLKDTKPENYFGTRIGRTGAKEQVIYNFDLWMQYPVLNQDAAHLELNERYRINYAYGSPLVMDPFKQEPFGYRNRYTNQSIGMMLRKMVWIMRERLFQFKTYPIHWMQHLCLNQQ